MTQTPPELNRRISDAVERMPAFPKSVQKLLQLTRDINCQPKDLVSVIETDPVMTVKILRVLNSGVMVRRDSLIFATHSCGISSAPRSE